MKKVAFAYLLILCLSVVGVLSSNLFVKDAYAIPNSNVPTPDGHPHSCGVPGHAQFIDGTVTWENGSGIWVNGNLTNPDGTCHQHHCNLSFGGLAYPHAPPGHWPPREATNPNEVYEVYGCWDNENFKPGLPWVWQDPFVEGHGFINEFPEAGGGSNCIPDYYFSSTQTNGIFPCNWPVIDGVNATDLIRQAFTMWGDIESDKPDLVTGIAFEETTDLADADIVLYWEPIPDPGRTRPGVRPIWVRFDNNTNWCFEIDKTKVDPGELHFFSIALHEIGHVVGLCDQNDTEDVMYYICSAGPEPAGGPWFTVIDADSEHGVRDLYSIPAPDFGDAEDPPYPTKSPRAPPPAVDNGARNLFIGREWLGANPFGQTTTTWEWEAKVFPLADVPDDGCIFWLPPLGVGGIGFVDVTVSVTDWQSSRYNNTFGYELYLAIWIDWSETNGWAHPGEMVVMDRLRPSTWGQNTWPNRYNFTVPNGWTPTWARARLVYAKTAMNLFPWGPLPTLDSPDNGGEVEDYFLPLESHPLPPVVDIIYKENVGQGYTQVIFVDVWNPYNTTIDADVSVSYDDVLLGTETITLDIYGEITLWFYWDTSTWSKGTYGPFNITVTCANLTTGYTYEYDYTITFKITVPGDVNGDCICDMADISMIIDAFMTCPGDPKWDPNCDVNCDGVVDMADISIAIYNFMKTCETDP